MAGDRTPVDRGHDAPTELTPWERPIGRRAFLGTVFGGIAGLTLLSKVGSVQRAVSNATTSLKPGGGWRIYAVQSPLPTFDPDTFELQIGGEVEHPVTLSWKQIQEMTSFKADHDFHCVTGWSVMDVHWEGIDPQDIIDLVKPTSKARFVTMTSLEGPYVDQISLEQFLHPGNVVAHTMDGAPLTQEHGSPLRMVLPQMYGYKGVKWLNGLEFVVEQEPGYWEVRGYDVDAYVGKSNGRG